MQITGESQTLELASNPDSISVVERMIDDIRNKYNVSEDMFGNMLVAITEAVTNAIYHGNKSDPAKMVSISCTHTPHSIVFTIADQGPGFDYYNLPDPTAPENLEKINWSVRCFIRNIPRPHSFSKFSGAVGSGRL